MSYWDDILDEEQERMDYNFEDGEQFKDKDIPLASFKATGKLADGTVSIDF